LLDVRGADAAKVADRLWATRIFQATYAEMETRLPPYHHRWCVQTAGGCRWENDVPENGMFREGDWRGIERQK
jgi:hypothetical protein